MTSEGDLTVAVSGQASFLDRNRLTDTGSLINADLYNDVIYDIDYQDGLIDVTLSGLVANRTYAVTFYSWDLTGGTSSHPIVTTTFTPTGDTLGDLVSIGYDRGEAPAVNDQYAVVGFFASPTGSLTFQVSAAGSGGDPSAYTYTILNGLEVAIAEEGGSNS